MLLLGFFLLLEQINIMALLISAPGRILSSASRIPSGLREVTDFMAGLLSPSNLAGISLVLAATAAVLWRLRTKFLNSDHWNASACPKCGSSLHRIHRTGLDRFLSRSILPDARRYLCSEQKCGWEGLLCRIHHRDHQPHGRLISARQVENPQSK
jgi:hypothetical protein